MTRLSFSRFLPLAVVICSMAAWAGGPARHVSRSQGDSLLYVGLFSAQAVNVYDLAQNGAPIYQILDDVGNVTGDIVVDQSQNVYIATHPESVTVYPPGGLVPAFRYPFVDQHQPAFPTGMAVDSNGILYAALYGDGVVAEYRGARKAKLVIQAPAGNTAWAVAVDAKKNVYFEYASVTYPAPAGIQKCPRGSTQCTDLGITLGAQADHLALDNQGNLIACDNSVPQIDIFPAGGGQPRVISQGLVGCTYFALDGTGTNLYVANESLSHSKPGNQGISVFDYASGTLLNTISNGIPGNDFISGVALSPAH